MRQVFSSHQFDAVIHFAGLKSVDESVANPVDYYRTNVIGTINLCQLLKEFPSKYFIFSSSATVYGVPQVLPITESAPVSPTNPYGHSKLMAEEIIRDFQQSRSNTSIAILRYFNPAGADPSGQIGEDPRGVPANLLPFVAQVASGIHEAVNVYGNDYNTKDGTGVRDYIHVVDLAYGHICALNAMASGSTCFTCNLSTGRGYSVIEIIDAFSQVCGSKLNYEIKSRRLGDIAECYADPYYAEELLNWKAKRGIKEMCQDLWNWQVSNPTGYE
jgi:UDP-glucose 4-epimerase